MMGMVMLLRAIFAIDPLTALQLPFFPKTGIHRRLVCISNQRTMEGNSLMWFRKGLRIHDNPALEYACQNAKHLFPVFVLDPWYLEPDTGAPSPGSSRVGVTRIKFFLECLADLDGTLRERGSRLLLFKGNPVDIIPQLLKQWAINKLCFEFDIEPYAQKRDNHIKEFASNIGVEVFSPVSHTLFCPEEIIKKIPWNDDDYLLAAWRDAQTGYPWIDAVMVQLRKWGWMHHLARHTVACFLTRGDLFVHWEKGRDVFERLLIDADWALNNGNWMWLSCSAFFSQYYRVYSPISFGKRYDPDGKYIRHFLPVLKDMPKQYIYEPWTAPLEVQKKAKCIIGKDYPKPVVSHVDASKECKDRIAAAYALSRETDGKPTEEQLQSLRKTLNDGKKIIANQRPYKRSRQKKLTDN